MRVRVQADADAVADAAVREFIDAARASILRSGRFLVALAGGRTPTLAYRRLGSDLWKDSLDWSRVEVFWGDERAVPPTHAESNFRTARLALLDPIGIDPRQVHRMRGEADDLEEAAREYEQLLVDTAGTPPALDLVMLGMGPDGHVASLFPGTAALDASGRFVVANDVPALGTRRLTLTFDAILAARAILVQVTGADKADAIRRTVRPDGDDNPVPARRLSEAGDRVVWLLDPEAAASIPPRTTPNSQLPTPKASTPNHR